MKEWWFEQQFHEQTWESHAQLDEAIRENRSTPSEFNVADAIIDQPFETTQQTALIAHAEDGTVEAYSYEDIRSQAARVATYLDAQGIQQGDRIGINLPQRPETVIAHLAAWMLGAIPVPLSTLFGTDALRYRLQDSGATACLVDTRNLEAFRAIREDLASLSAVVTVDEPAVEDDETPLADVLTDYPDTFTPRSLSREEPATILYTSGSTGDPKGVVLSHGMYLGYLPTFVLYCCNLTVEENRHWTPAEWAWSGSLCTTVFPGLCYGQTILAHVGGRFDPETAFELIERHELTNCHLPPAALHKMKEVDTPEERYELDSVRVISSGGDTVGTELVDWAGSVFPGAAVHAGYGQTEALSSTNDCLALWDSKDGSIGRVAPGHDMAVLDPETRERIDEPGEIGELAVRHEGDPVCFLEYWNKEEKTAQKRHGEWHLTEDLGWVDEDGHFWFKGRTDDVIISAGYRLGPAEIEGTIEDYPTVEEAAVVGIPDDARGEVPKAFVVLSDDADDSASTLEGALQQFVRDRLAQHEYPREVEVVETLPRTVTGKIQRSKLTQRDD